MKLVTDSIESFRDYIGQTFTCSVTKREYKVEESDIRDALAEHNGNVNNVHLVCPDCQARVTFESGQMSGSYLHHDGN